MPLARPDISIIIVSWNTCELVLACLDALPIACGTLTREIYVVDNSSGDGTVRRVRARFPNVHIIRNATNVGFAAANNQALRLARGRYMLLLNSDTVALPAAIERLVRFADGQPRLGMVGPQLLNGDRSFQGSFAYFPSLATEVFSATGIGRRLFGPWYPNSGPRESRRGRRVDYIQGACMLVRRQAVLDAGLMDEGFFMYSEDVDWCMRLGKTDWAVWFLPEARVVHYGGQSTWQVRPAMLRALYRSKIRFFRKHYGRRRAFMLQVVALLVLTGKWLRQTRGTPRSARVRWSDLDSQPVQEPPPLFLNRRSLP